jgi:hypothetical protein
MIAALRAVMAFGLTPSAICAPASSLGRKYQSGLKMPESRFDNIIPASPACGNQFDSLMDSITCRAASGATPRLHLAACNRTCILVIKESQQR